MPKEEIKEREDVETEDQEQGAEEESPRLAEKKPTVSTSDEGEVKVKFPGGVTRSQAKKEARRLEDERRQAEMEALRREVAELRGTVRAQPASAAPARQADPIRDEIRAIRKEQEMIAAHIKVGNASGSDLERLKERFYELDDRKQELAEARIEARVRSMYQPQQQQSGLAELLAAEYPEVVNHPRALQYAKAYWEMQRASGSPESIEVAREALSRAAQQFGLRARAPALTDAQKARYGGVPSQSSSRMSSSNEVVLTKDQQRLARAMYPHLEDDQAFATWARNIGSKLSDE